MRPHVDLEAVFVHVAVAADVALELGADVRLEVPRQPGWARGRPLTNVAFVPARKEEQTRLQGQYYMRWAVSGSPISFRGGATIVLIPGENITYLSGKCTK